MSCYAENYTQCFLISEFIVFWAILFLWKLNSEQFQYSSANFDLSCAEVPEETFDEVDILPFFIIFSLDFFKHCCILNYQLRHSKKGIFEIHWSEINPFRLPSTHRRLKLFSNDLIAATFLLFISLFNNVSYFSIFDRYDVSHSSSPLITTSAQEILRKLPHLIFLFDFLSAHSVVHNFGEFFHIPIKDQFIMRNRPSYDWPM